MKRALLLARFLGLACLIAWLLLAPLGAVGRGYVGGLRSAANGVAERVGTDYKLRVKPTGKVKKDTQLVLRKRVPGAVGPHPYSKDAVVRPFNAWALGWLPTVSGLALVLATPIPWRRKLRSAVLVTACTQVYVCLRLWLLGVQMVLDDPSLHAEMPTFLTNPTTHDLLIRMTNLDRETGLFFLVPLGLWAAFTLRPEDVERLWLGSEAREQDAA